MKRALKGKEKEEIKRKEPLGVARQFKGKWER